MNIIVYPYSIEHSYIYTYRELFDFNIVRYMCYGSIPSTSREENNDDYCSFVDLVEGKLCFDSFDAFVVIDKVPDEKELYNMVDFICFNGKDIICLEEEYLCQISKICEKYNVKLLRNNYKKIEFPEKNWSDNSEIMDIDVPIVAVLGIGQNVQKFDLQLYFRKRFIDKGYKVSQIGTKKISGLYGFHPLPDFIFNSSYSDVDKVYAINRIIKEISVYEKPDVILIGIPDSLLPLNNKHRFSFGLYAYEILNAVQPDFVVMSLMANDGYNDDFYSEILKMAKYKYNINIDAYFVSQFCPLSNSIWSEKLSYVYLPNLKLLETNYNVYTTEDLIENKLFEQVEGKLLLYGKYEQF